MHRQAGLFSAIGNTPDEVAATLRGAGIRGLCLSTRYFNPIVQYVYKQLGNHALHIDVKGGVTLTVAGAAGTWEIPLPPPVITFLVNFNDGRYPDLVSDETADLA